MAVFAFSIVAKNESDTELKNNVWINATIVDITPSRSCTRIAIEYTYNGVKLKNDFSVIRDSFKIKEKVLIKVARKYPDRYIEFVRKIR